MTEVTMTAKEAVGRDFSPAKMLQARSKTFAAIKTIAAQIRPGMTEQQAKDLAKKTLEQMGMDRTWHGRP